MMSLKKHRFGRTGVGAQTGQFATPGIRIDWPPRAASQMINVRNKFGAKRGSVGYIGGGSRADTQQAA